LQGAIAVPFLNRSVHLSEDDLVAVWLDARPDAHLDVCAKCAARYAALAAGMEGLQSDAADEADEIFTPDRLSAQQAHILRRLEAAERPARVIAFPGARRIASAPAPRVRRWVAGAAAAGLLIGLAAGTALNFLPDGSTTLRQASAPLAAPTTNARSSDISDDFFMMEADLAVGSRGVPALAGIEAATPLGRDVQ
jgi:hypothetical protein